jgi:uncharacterized repeat protein (TIGR01451 family)
VSEEQSDPAGAWDVEESLSITKTAEDVNGASLYVGDEIEYTIVVTNEGAATSGVMVTDTLPSGVDFVSATPSGHTGPNPLVWDVGTLDSGEVWTATVTVEVNGTEDPLSGNVASASSDQVSEEQSDPAGAWDVENALGITKTAEDVNGAPLYVGDEIEYTIVVTNEGAATSGVEVADIIPGGVILVSVTPSGYTGSNPLVWDVGALGAGAEWTAIITVEVNGTEDPLSGNVASVLSDQVGKVQTDPVWPGSDHSLWRTLYMPTILKKDHRDTYEPNDALDIAYGPVLSGSLYESYIWSANDNWDFYWFDPSGLGMITINLTSIPPNSDYDLYLFESSVDPSVAQSLNWGNADEQIKYDLRHDGKHYIGINRWFGWNDEDTYLMQAFYP